MLAAHRMAAICVQVHHVCQCVGVWVWVCNIRSPWSPYRYRGVGNSADWMGLDLILPLTLKDGGFSRFHCQRFHKMVDDIFFFNTQQKSHVCRCVTSGRRLHHVPAAWEILLLFPAPAAPATPPPPPDFFSLLTPTHYTILTGPVKRHDANRKNSNQWPRVDHRCAMNRGRRVL